MSNYEAYQQKAQAKLDEVNARLDLLKAQAKDKGANARIELDKQMKALEEKREDLAQNLAELRDAGAEAAEDFAEKINKAIDNAGKALEGLFE